MPVKHSYLTALKSGEFSIIISLFIIVPHVSMTVPTELFKDIEELLNNAEL